MSDIAVLTGGHVLDEETGMSYDQADVNVLGSAKKVIIGKDDTIIIDGRGEQ